MNGENKQVNRQLRTLKIIVVAMLVVAPIFYLAVAGIVAADSTAGVSNNMILYILLIVALVTPAVAPVIERLQLQTYKSGRSGPMTPMNLFFTVSLMKAAMTETVFILGLVMYLVSGSYWSMIYFYPIGIAWTYVHWPRREKYENLMRKLGTS